MQPRNSSGKWTRVLGTCALLGAVMISTAGCVLEPYPPPPPVAAAPGYSPGYYGTPCCYSYYDYPPYYYGEPSVGFYYGYDHHGYHHWR